MRPATLVLLIMVPAVLLAIVLALFDALRSPFQRTASLEPTEHLGMGHRFRMPRAYLIRRDQYRGSTAGPGDGVIMEGVLPHILPYGEATAGHFETAEARRNVVHFGLWGIKYGTGLWDPYFTPRFLAQCRGERAGLRICRRLPSSRNSEVLVSIDGETKIALDCHKDGSGLYELCEGSFPLVDNVKLTILFSKRQLDRHRAIIASVFERVCAFHRPGGDRPITYNQCEEGAYHGPTKPD